MTEQEYTARLVEIQREYEVKKRELYKEYALAHNTVKVGGTFTDHLGSIRVDRIGLYVGNGQMPSCIYEGVELKKDGTPKKGEPKRQAYQINAR